MAQKARLLILDEPTSRLSGTEAAADEQIRRLRGEVAVLYVSHRLEECSIRRQITVLRDGHGC